MDIFLTVVYVYLGIGFVYAIYIWLFAGDYWYSIPVNTLGGPINIIYQVLRSYFRKTYELSDIFKGKSAVIFDLDGTIVDSQPFRNKAFEKVLDTLEGNWNVPDYPHGLNEREKWDFVLNAHKGLKANFTIEDLAEHTRTEFIKLYKDVDAMEGFWSLVRYLKETKKFKLGLATNSDRSILDIILKKLGAEGIFDSTIAGDEVKRRKPHPEIYKEAAKQLGVNPKKIVVFEDTVVGATAASAAGMEVIAIWNGVDEEKEDFPRGIKFFLPDFGGMTEEIEKSRKQRLEEAVKSEEEFDLNS